jgi:hypothetical protein
MVRPCFGLTEARRKNCAERENCVCLWVQHDRFARDMGVAFAT